jgi:hypothetical protein
MAETLGMLCDKLTIVKLKQFHTEDSNKLSILNGQAVQLQEEIDQFVMQAFSGEIPLHKLTFASNKVFKKEGNETSIITGNIGAVFFQLANINCKLWHEVDKGYDIDSIPNEEKGNLIKSLAVLNLERNNCIDEIDRIMRNLVENKLKA